MKLTFTRVKETKNKFRFEEDPSHDHGPIIGPLYFDKWFINRRQDKEHITITIEED